MSLLAVKHYPGSGAPLLVPDTIPLAAQRTLKYVTSATVVRRDHMLEEVHG